MSISSEMFAGASVPLVDRDGWPAPAPGLHIGSTEARLASDLMPVLRQGADVDPALVAYLMYRGVHLPPDGPSFCRAGIRYDITVLAGAWPGPEPVKTLGHFHSQVPGSSVTYPELYQVISGWGLYIIQREGVEVVLVEARSGDLVWVPPGSGHVTVNPGPGPLVMANLISVACLPNYEPFLSRGGAACHIVSGPGNADYKIAVNHRYEEQLPTRQITPGDWNHEAGPEFHGVLASGECMYRCFVTDSSLASVLNHPDAGWG